MIKDSENIIKDIIKRFFSLSQASKRYNVVFRIAIYILLIDISFVFLFPFLYMIITSLKSLNDLYDMTVNWVPNVLQFSNYVDAFKLLEYPLHLLNSVSISFVSVAGHLISCSIIAYGLARFNFRGRQLVFVLVIFSIIIPSQVVILPQYMMYVALNQANSYLPLILPTFLGFGLKGGLFIFIFRQYFKGLPTALEEAARIDGCGPFKTFFKIVLPISKPSLLVSGILSMVWHWNDYFEPAIYLGKLSMIPLPSVLPSIYKAYLKVADSIDSEQSIIVTEGVVMAATFLVVLPILIIFLILQKEFTEGIERTGLVE